MSRETKKYAPPLAVPLTFDQLASNIFRVDPKKLPPKARPGASKTAKKPAPKKKARQK